MLNSENVNENPEASRETLMQYLKEDLHDDEDRKPEGQLAMFWLFCQPFLFGTVGASIKFSDMDGGMLGEALVVILCGVGTRWLMAFLVCGLEGKFTINERVLMASAWIPKATVQAALSYTVIAQTELTKDNMTEKE